MDRRQLLAAGLGAPLSGAAAGPAMAQAPLPRGPALVPASDFPSVQAITYLNSAQKHPMCAAVAKALHAYTDINLSVANASGSSAGPADLATLAAFAHLINAEPVEVSFVPSTMGAENVIVQALGFPGAKGNIVTDDLHYDGSVYLYQRLAKMGVEVRQVRQHGGRVAAEDIVKAIDGNTGLVAISLVSYVNGFEHDLVPICAAAHAKGAFVYADIIQAAGATPVDVKASGVDFAAASTHKWMMGDHGLGFVYVRQDLIRSGRFKGVQFGWKQKTGGDFWIFPDGADHAATEAYAPRPGAVGQFEVGTYALAPMEAVRASLAYVDKLGVANIRAHAKPMSDLLRANLPKLGYASLSPPECAPHINTFHVADQAMTKAKLDKAGVQVRLNQNFMRVSVSVFNTQEDIARIEAALA